MFLFKNKREQNKIISSLAWPYLYFMFQHIDKEEDEHYRLVTNQGFHLFIWCLMLLFDAILSSFFVYFLDYKRLENAKQNWPKLFRKGHSLMTWVRETFKEKSGISGPWNSSPYGQLPSITHINVHFNTMWLDWI